MRKLSREFRVSKYLEMARLTNNEIDREDYINKALYYLENESWATILETDDYLLNDGDKSIYEFISSHEDGEFHRVPTGDAYEMFLKFCEEQGCSGTNHIDFTRRFKKMTNYETKQVRINKEITRIFYLEQ